MPHLLVKPHAPDAEGTVLSITPDSAGWSYVGFEVRRLAPGQTAAAATGEREVCLVLLSGKAAASAGGEDFGTIGGRASPFDGPAWSLYVPAHTDWSLTADGEVEVAICSAPGRVGSKPRVIEPGDVGTETRGEGTNTRHVRNILPDSEPADSLLVVEVITPAGHWSSYPPHKHDRDAPPEESALEEIYYHRLEPRQGFAMQRVYTDDRSIDETMSVEDGDCVMVPRGYHPVGAPYGYELYYLNVMAGPERVWRFQNDPAHDWIVRKR